MPDGEHPHLQVHTVDGVTVARIVDAEILFAETAVESLGEELDDLVVRQGQTRLVLDLGGVRYMASAMLGKLVALEQKARQAGGRLRLCGVGPTVRDILGVTRLERVFDIDEDEQTALARFPK